VTRFRYLFACLLALLAIIPAARAQSGLNHAEVDIYASQSALPAGGDARLAITVSVERNWHAQSALPYSPNFIPTRLKLDPTPGVTFGDIQYPRGIDEPTNPILGYDKISVYRNSIIILVPVKIAADAKPGKIAITGKVRLQYCDDKTGNCLLPVDLPVKLSTSIVAGGSKVESKDADVFEEADAQKFYTAEEFAQAATRNASHSTTKSAPETNPSGTNANQPGVTVTLATEKEQLDYINTTDFAPASEKEYTIVALVVFALLGGAILNIMPCVLPVIPLKVLSLVQQAGGDRKHSLYHALVFSAGIITLFLILGGILRTLGFFYGEQFQSTIFLVSLAYFVLALALSMIGVWTINTPNAVYKLEKPRSGYAGSFMSGLLATLLATPCSAPFLGPFLAWALVQPSLVTVLSLGLIGVGMALPYVILASFPEALKKIPTAGRWAELLKQFLGIVMVAVAVFLITRIANVGYWPAAFFGAVLLGGVCWAWGQIPSPTAEPAKLWTIRIICVAVGVLIAVPTVYFTLPQRLPASTTPVTVNIPNQSDGKTWLPFNTAILTEARRQNRIVVVDWTADWCLNCKLVEATVLETETVSEQFKKKNVILLRADLTGENAPAKALNAKLKGQSIPVLAIFDPANPTRPHMLRDLYTTSEVLSALPR
jgi:thiol:disulfide interchange protein